MNSVKTKSKNYSMRGNKAIAQVLLLPESNLFRIYVAWEWEPMAQKGFFAIMKSTHLHTDADFDMIMHVCNFGQDITETPEAKKLFNNLF